MKPKDFIDRMAPYLPMDDEGGGGSAAKEELPGQPTEIVDANRFICPQDGGHLVNRNPCPRHGVATTRLGGDD